MSQRENIKLPIGPNIDKEIMSVTFWNYIAEKTPDRISQILAEMDTHDWLIHFLDFMHRTCLHNQMLKNNRERFERYQTILRLCPRFILTRFLRSINERCVISILERSDVIWTRYFVGLIESGHDDEVNMILSILMMAYDMDFVSNLVLRLIHEASNPDLPDNLRQIIFDFVCRNGQMVWIIVRNELGQGQDDMSFEELVERMNRWALNFSQTNHLNLNGLWSAIPRDSQPVRQHREVDAEPFVKKTFPSQHPLNPHRIYCCVICHSGSDELNDDGSLRIFRLLTCCSARCVDPNDMKYACHQCLLKWVKACNTPEPEQEFKRTDQFTCPNCRDNIPFFP